MKLFETMVSEEKQNATTAINKHSNIAVRENDYHTNVNSLTSINLLDEKEVEKAKAFLTQVMRSNKGGLKTVEDGFAMIMRAQDLKLPFSTCLEHVHVVNGKTGVDIHVIKALLLRAGTITWECTKDYVPLYEYTDGNSVYVEDKLPSYCIKCKSKKEADAKNKEAIDNGVDDLYVYPVMYFKGYDNNIYKSYQWHPALAIALNNVHAVELQKAGKVPVFRIPNQPIDYITEYTFKRKINGTEMTATSKFTYSEAVAADLFSKDTYAKYGRILIGHRAFTYGARDIASDMLFGVMETTELKVVNNLDIDEADVIDITNA